MEKWDAKTITLSAAILLLLALILWLGAAWAVAPAGTTKGFTCPVAGSSAVMLPVNFSRVGLIIANDSGVAIRVGMNVSGTPNLDDTNSMILPAGGTISDSSPSIFQGAVNCMSTTASTVTIHYAETSNP